MQHLRRARRIFVTKQESDDTILPADAWGEIIAKLPNIHLLLALVSKSLRITVDGLRTAIVLEDCHPLRDRHINHLPPNLRSLSMMPNPNFVLDLTDDCIPALPRTLEVLDLHCTSSIQTIADLPTTIQRLGVAIHYDHATNQPLPPGLRHLDVLSVVSWSSLPVSLASLHLRQERNLHRIHITQTASHFSGLRHLHILRSAFQPFQTIDPAFFSHLLPPTLLSLHLEHSVSTVGAPICPSGLTSLRIWSLNIIPSGGPHRGLPVTLRELHIRKAGALSWAALGISALTDLRTLHIPDVQDGQPLADSLVSFTCLRGFSDCHIRFLPRFLQALTVPLQTFDCPPLSKACWLTDGAIGRLPRSITALHIPDADVTNAAFLHLPRGLRHVTLPYTALLTSTVAAHLPDGLLSLHITSFSWAILPTDKAIDDAILGALPRSITSLDIRGSFKLSASGLSHLPPHLVTLCLRSPIHLPEAAVRHLPASIRAITIHNTELALSRAAAIYFADHHGVDLRPTASI